MSAPLNAARAALYREDRLPNFSAIRFARRHGIDREEARAHAGLFEMAKVRFDGDRFELAGDDGEEAVVVEALAADAETVDDLVAFGAADPLRIATACGRAAILGLAALHNPATYFLGRPLRVHRSVLDWLRSGCAGIVILDGKAAARLLIDVRGDIAVEDVAHAIDLARMLSGVASLERIVVLKRKAA